ncbi:hypothetical protein [Micromonospora sp. CA-246542]|uniref:hypothetical protein n=1 Tax=Micromonospora sp. CA-246542 TaxID=3239959 RepID=UPI003D93CDED
MKLDDVMDGIARRIKDLGGLQVHAQPPKTIIPPAAVVSYPETIEYDATYGRGMDRISGLSVWLVVGKVTDRSARDALAAYAADTGAKSVKLALEDDSDEDRPWDDLHVASAEFDILTIAGIDYIAAGFTLNLACQGGTS